MTENAQKLLDGIEVGSLTQEELQAAVAVLCKLNHTSVRAQQFVDGADFVGKDLTDEELAWCRPKAPSRVAAERRRRRNL